MVASILGCPKCNTLIMEETAICPGCHHVLKQDHAGIAKAAIEQSQKYDGSQETPCRECQALNRNGLVRCWQCGAFLKEEMERIYLAMQAQPAAVISSHELVVETSTSAESGVLPAPFSEESDFELDDDIQMCIGSDDDDSSPEIPNLQETADYSTEQAALPLLHKSSEPASRKKKTTDEEEEDDDDELLKLAVREEREQNRHSAKRKRSVAKGTFLMKGPCGDCKIRVQNYHQGMMGQCPKCALPFVVPILPKQIEVKTAGSSEPASTKLPPEDVITGSRWHEFPLSKFKPKADFLAGKGDLVDLVHRGAELLIVWPEKKGLLGTNARQLDKMRTDVSAHLAAGKPLDQLPAPRHELVSAAQLVAARIIQPVSTDDFTTGLRLFGPGLIGLEIPAPPQPDPGIQARADQAASAAAPRFAKKKPAPKKPKPVKVVEPLTRCLVVTVTQFRQLRSWLAVELQTAPNWNHPAIPLADSLRTWSCQLSDQEFVALEGTEFYQGDPSRPVTTVGWLCQCSQVAITESARAEQKFGGKKSAGLANTKCPQCEQPFGLNPLVHLTSVVAPPVPKPETSKEKKARKAAAAPGETTDSSPAEGNPNATSTAAPPPESSAPAAGESPTPETPAAATPESEKPATKSSWLSRFSKKK